MRTLSKKQKKAIDKIMEDNKDIKNIDDISNKQFYTIEVMNIHETFYQNLNRYITDKYFERLYK